MKKHYVLIKSSSGHHGGQEKYAMRIAKAFVEKGAQVTLLTTEDSSPFITPPEVAIQTFSTSRWPPFLKMEQFDQQVQAWLKKNPADLVFGMDRNRFQTHIRAGNGVHSAYLESRKHTEGLCKHWICRMNPMHWKILKLEKEAFENPELQKLLTNSHMVKKEILECYQIDPSKLEVVHNGVEWAEMQEDFDLWPEKRDLFLKTHHLSPDRFHLLFIGHGYSRKGLFFLLKALSLLPSSYPFHLSVVGKERHIEKFIAQAHLFNLSDRVTFFGAQKDIRPFYQMADALVIPSFYDPFANVTLEALAMGLFIISSKHNGGSEIIDAESGSMIEDLLSVESFQKSLLTALKHPKTKGSALLLREKAKSFDFSLQMDKILQACETVC